MIRTKDWIVIRRWVVRRRQIEIVIIGKKMSERTDGFCEGYDCPFIVMKLPT